MAHENIETCLHIVSTPIPTAVSSQRMPTTGTQKALILETKQGRLAVGSRDIPKPGPNQLLVKVLAASLNPVDWKIYKDGQFMDNYPAVLGTDVAGDVVEIGEGVKNFSVGDRV